ncbi:conserved Plasmodium protein, unknown function [Plasmodium gallinaceum]|uniref:Uncharacterized protein n=1 Tax=Plasmodium gallinaceum TaxID=5849 RepID=A0A1J1GM94_PLAGA|nr:conserved Plasmodium protein, unknown function [Plasmodium gallinaceum]CRG93560.1 conserved Plasmodium protein, unknown function [Plasmodium gallinaceum]
MEKSNYPLKNKSNKNDINNVDDSLCSSNKENDIDDLEDLPEYERELILAKRHEEYMKKKHRSILLKNISIDNNLEGNCSDDNNIHTLNKKSSFNNKSLQSKSKKQNIFSENVETDKINKKSSNYKKNRKLTTKTGKHIKQDKEETNYIKSNESKKKSDSFIHNERGSLKLSSDNNSKSKNIISKKNNNLENDDKNLSADSYEKSSDTYSSSYHKKKKSKKKKKISLNNEENKNRKSNKDNNNLITTNKNKILMSSNQGSGMVEERKSADKCKYLKNNRSEREIEKQHNELYSNDKSDDIIKKKKLHLKKDSEKSFVNNNNIKNHKNESFIYSNDQQKKLPDDSKELDDLVKKEKHLKEQETPERLIYLYKEEKKVKLDIYKYMSYEIITYFQLKKTFLLDMSEHVNFPYYVIGHIIKIIDSSKLIKVSNILKNQHKNNSQETNKSNNSMDEKKNIFFLTNVINSENYFSLDRHTNIKFEIAHLENLSDVQFFNKIKNIMNQNKKISINELSIENYETYICDMNNISDEKLTIDEYNFIKLFSVNLEILKNFHLFLKEKIEDLKNFHYTEKQIQDLVEMKKKKSFHEIFMNNKNIDTLPISRITVQREICSILREIDTLNYAKRRIKDDINTLSKLNNQIELLTKKKDILREQLEKSRTNFIVSKSNENFTQEKEKNLSRRKPIKTYLKTSMNDEISSKFLGVEEKNISDLANYLYEEKRTFNNFVTSKFFDMPLNIHYKIVNHFLLGNLQNNSEVFYDDGTEKKSEEHELFGINISKYVTLFDDIKKSYK